MRRVVGRDELDKSIFQSLDEGCAVLRCLHGRIHLDLRPKLRVLVGHRGIEKKVERRNLEHDIASAFSVLSDHLEALSPGRPVAAVSYTHLTLPTIYSV